MSVYRRPVMRAHEPSAKDLRTVTFYLAAANILVWFIDILLENGAGGGSLSELGGLYFPAVRGGEAWRLFTAMFLHSGFTHLIYNMLALFALGFPLEETMGHARYAAVYLLAGVGGNAFVLLTEWLSGEFHFTVGASGAIFGLLGAYLALTLNRRDGMAGLPLPSIAFAFFMMMIPGFYNPRVSMTGHLGGFLAGFIAAFLIGTLFPVRRSRF